jgi:hypothetical protein
MYQSMANHPIPLLPVITEPWVIFKLRKKIAIRKAQKRDNSGYGNYQGIDCHRAKLVLWKLSLPKCLLKLQNIRSI